MSEQITAYIRRVAALNDADLEEELRFINRIHSMHSQIELDSHTLINGAYETSRNHFKKKKKNKYLYCTAENISSH